MQMGSSLVSIEFQIYKIKRDWLYNNVNAINIIVHLKMAKMVNFILSVFTTKTFFKCSGLLHLPVTQV